MIWSSVNKYIQIGHIHVAIELLFKLVQCAIKFNVFCKLQHIMSLAGIRIHSFSASLTSYDYSNLGLHATFLFLVSSEAQGAFIALRIPKVIEYWLSGLLASVLPPFDHRLMSHGAKSLLILRTPCVHTILP